MLRKLLSCMMTATDDVQTLFNLHDSYQHHLTVTIQHKRGQPVKRLIICILETGTFGLKGFKIAHKVFKCIKLKI